MTAWTAHVTVATVVEKDGKFLFVEEHTAGVTHTVFNQPAGHVESGETLIEAAIRETMEELKLPSQKIDLWGEIDYLVSNQQTIHCFVGQLFVENWQSIQPNEEVERLFTIPLEKLKNQPPTYYRLETEVQATGDFPFERIRNGRKYKFSHYDRRIPFYDIGDENLWGMTAQFTHRFTEILEGK